MRNLKFVNILIIMLSIVIADQKSWATTTFDYYWHLGKNRIRFIEPVSATPFEARIGYLTYGGSDYWDDLFSTELGQISPVILDSTNNSFSYLNAANTRILTFIEFDFLKINIPNLLLKKINQSQNFLDIQIGLGYRYIHSISEPNFPNYWENTVPDNQNPGTLFFKPKIHDFNINTSIDYHILEKIRAYIYHSLGYSFGTFYEYSGTGNYLEGNGISEGLGFGLRYISKLEKYNFNLVYGLEYRLHRNYINTIKDPSQISHITGLDMYSKGLIISIGTIFGGNKTSADYAFLKMLNEKYIDAEPGFENYINSEDVKPKKKLAQKMLQFTRTQIPYEQYDYGLQNQYSNDIDSAIYWFNESTKTANNDLLFEINAHKKDLAIMLIDSISIYKNNLTFSEAEKILKKAEKLADDYYYIKEMLANLYIEQGESLEKKNNFDKAYIYYNKANEVYPDSKIALIEKYINLVDKLIQQGEQALEKQEYPLAIKSFEFALKIDPDKKNELNPLIQDIYSRLSLDESIMIKQQIETIVQQKKNEIKNSLNKKILIGMSANEVENAIGLPNLKDVIEQGNRTYQLWTYQYPSKLRRIYLENDLVIKVE